MKLLLLSTLVCTVVFRSEAGYRVENVALHGRATMSSVYREPTIGYLALAMNAIDGNQNADYYKGSCVHTDYEMSPWWRVDLMTPHVIQYVTITNRILKPERINGAEILIGNTLANNGNNNARCANVTSIASGAAETFQCHGMIGRYVNIIIRGRNEWLHFCEFEVYGYPEKHECLIKR